MQQNSAVMTEGKSMLDKAIVALKKHPKPK